MSAARALGTKTLDANRNYEPVVMSEAQLQIDNFKLSAVDRFTGYRYTASTDTWSLVPLQIDQRHITNFGQLATCMNGKPLCACGPTNTCGLCELSYIWDGQSDPDDDPQTPNVLDPNDEVVFMAKDTGDQAADTSFPNGTSGLSRYEIKVGNAHSGYGWIYLYRYTSTAPVGDRYMEISTTGSGATQSTTFRGCNNPLLGGFDTYEAVLTGNWSLTGLKVQSAGTTAACGVDFSSDLDVLDRLKWRMGPETDETWNNTSTYLGLRNGIVRSIRGSIGAASGFGTTHYFLAYPTYWQDDVDLRVHTLRDPILGYIDWNSAAANLNGTQCPQQNFDVWRKNGNTPTLFDYVDGGGTASCSPTPTAPATEPRQLNGPYISLAEIFIKDPQHPLPGMPTENLFYLDSRATTDDTPEDEPGAFGEVGVNLNGVNSTEETNCTDPPRFAHFSRIWQIKRSDSGVSRAVTLDENQTKVPFEATSIYQCPNCGGGGSPTTPCAPSLGGTNPANGCNTHLALSSSCGTSGLWFRIYRAVGANGTFSLLASLGTNVAFTDFQVERGQTYRYYAESYNSAGQTSSASSTVGVTVTDTTAPAAPVISGGVSGSSASLAWDFTDDFDLAGYNVYRATQCGGPYTKLTVAGAIRATGYSVHSLQSGTTYYIVVKAVDQGGNESVASNEIALTP